MQTTALAVLVVYPLHGSGLDLGLVTALQFVPMLLFGTWGGLMADRMNKRTMLFFTQSTAMAIALVLGSLTLSGRIELWQVYLLAVLLGFFNMFDNPLRQTFVSEMVGRDLLPNAISLNSVLMNGARVVGPAIGGLIFVALGDGSTRWPCAFSSTPPPTPRCSCPRPHAPVRAAPDPAGRAGQGTAARGVPLRLVHPSIRDPLFVMAIVGIFAFNFTVTLPLLAKLTFHAGAGLFGAFTAAMGAGAVVGGLVVAHRNRPSPTSHGGHRPGVRGHDPGRRPGPDRGRGHRPAGPDGGLQHRLHRHRQRHPPAPIGPVQAGPGDGPLRHRLLGQHPDRRPPDGGDQLGRQPPGGPGGRRGGHPPRRDPPGRRYRRHDPSGLPAPGRAPSRWAAAPGGGASSRPRGSAGPVPSADPRRPVPGGQARRGPWAPWAGRGPARPRCCAGSRPSRPRWSRNGRRRTRPAVRSTG